MPTNLYGPNDNFDLEKSHVLPALIRKIHLGKALENNDWETVRTDLDKLPIEGVSGKATEEEILEILNKYGVQVTSPSGGGLEGAQVKVEIWGSGKPMREFLWSEDMADACVFIMENRDFNEIVEQRHSELDSESKSSHSKGEREIRNTHINIGTGEDISIKDLAQLIKSEIGFKGELYFNVDKPDGTMKKLTDVRKLNGLGWTYSIKLTEGVQGAYQFYLQS